MTPAPDATAKTLDSCARTLQALCDMTAPIDLRVETCGSFREELDAIAAMWPDEPALPRLAERYDAALHDDVVPALAENGLQIVDWAALNQFERVRALRVFEQQIHPLLTPMAVDRTHPFPRVPDLSLNLAVRMCDPFQGSSRFVCVTLPRGVARCVPIRAGRITTVDRLIRALLPSVLVSVQVVESSCFRVTRSRDGVVAGGSVPAGPTRSGARRGAPAVRLEVEQGASAELVTLLSEQLAVPASRVQFLRSSLAMGAVLDAGLFRPPVRRP